MKGCWRETFGSGQLRTFSTLGSLVLKKEPSPALETRSPRLSLLFREDSALPVKTKSLLADLYFTSSEKRQRANRRCSFRNRSLLIASCYFHFLLYRIGSDKRSAANSLNYQLLATSVGLGLFFLSWIHSGSSLSCFLLPFDTYQHSLPSFWADCLSHRPHAKLLCVAACFCALLSITQLLCFYLFWYGTMSLPFQSFTRFVPLLVQL